MAEFQTSSIRLVDWLKKRLLRSRNGMILQLRHDVARERFLNSGLVTIIVPFFNVEKYIFSALDSIRHQRYQQLEVILVDDGSTDKSRQIAESFVAKDDRFRILSSGERRGPGAARNMGLEVASGDYIAFIDADDIVPTGSIYKLIESLQFSGSDFVTGAYEHFAGKHRWKSDWVVREHASTRRGLSLLDAPGIVRNVFPWNKLFRTNFFLEKIGLFPEETLYEDQVPTALAYTRARKFDVISETVYHWRRRPTGDSITQNRASLEHLQNRFAVMEEVDGIYSLFGDLRVYQEWLEKSLFLDMAPFIQVKNAVDEEYMYRLFEKCEELASRLKHVSRTPEIADDSSEDIQGIKGHRGSEQ